VHVTPRAGRDQIEGVGSAGELRVRVRAAPADGAANAATQRLLASELGIAPSRVALVRGPRSRTKLFALDDVDSTELLARWPGLLTRRS
jgi:uncharacterized protein